MSSDLRIGADYAGRSHYAPDTRRDSSLLPAYPPLKRSDVTQALLDVFALAFWCLLIFVAGIAVTFAVMFWVFLIQF